MSFRTMYPPQKDSPTTFTLGDVSTVDTVINLASVTLLPQVLPYPLTFGVDKITTETVMVIAQNNTTHAITVTRGTPAYFWPAGSKVARNFTAKDFKDVQDNITDINTDLTTAKGTVATHVIDIAALKTTVGDASSGLVKGLASEITRATGAEGAEVTRATSVESGLETNKIARSELTQVITDWSYAADGAKVRLTITRYNSSTKATSTYTKDIPIVSNAAMGVMTPEAYNEITSLRADVNALINLGGRFIGVSYATKALLFAAAVAPTVKDNDFTYVLDDETQNYHTTRYVRSGNAWVYTFIVEHDPVGLATNILAGLVKSDAGTTGGKVFVETDGKMSVIGWDTLNTAATNAGTLAAAAIPKSLATAADQILVSTGVGGWAKKAIGDVKIWLGLKSAAYAESSTFATSAQGTLATNAIPKSLATTTDQLLTSNAAGSWIAKTFADFKISLGLKSAAYVETSTLATSAQGTLASNALPKNMATAVDQILVSTSAGNWAVKAIGDVKTWLGLKSAAYAESSTFATSAQGTAAVNAVPKDIATAANQVMISTGIGVWTGKAMADFKIWLGLGSAAYTASTEYATSAQGTLATNAIPKNLATTTEEILMSVGPSLWETRTFAQLKIYLGLKSAAYVDTSTLATSAQGTLANNAIPKSLATDQDQMLISTSAGTWLAYTVTSVKAWLGLGSAAYTASTEYATSAQGTLATNAIPKGTATAADQVMVSTGVGVWAIKSLAQLKTWLGLKSAAYVETSALATSAQGTLATNALPKEGGILQTHAEQVAVLATWGTVAINLAVARVFKLIPTGTCTFTVGGHIAGYANSFTLIIEQGATARLYYFPASVKWGDVGAPNLSQINKRYIITFISNDNGSTWNGIFGGAF